ncbi:MAG: hypothetical protein JW768_02645 [Chitinispirillaceae bacterium]|nr:hypothetical protein [Chitinispirillaceae bacterium]
MGIEIENSNPIMGRVLFPYFDIANFPAGIFDLELPVTLFAFNYDDKELSVAGGNIIVAIAAATIFYFNYNEKSIWGLGALFAAPQVLGNFKLHYRVFTDIFHVFAGQSTDYYLLSKGSYIYTESKVGIRLIAKVVAVDISVCKPWLRGPLNSNEPIFSIQLSKYLSQRKKN